MAPMHRELAPGTLRSLLRQAGLSIEHLQQLEDRRVIVDIVGKGRRVRTVPVPACAKTLVDRLRRPRAPWTRVWFSADFCGGGWLEYAPSADGGRRGASGDVGGRDR